MLALRLGVLPGVLGTIQATEAVKLITGLGEPLIGRLLTYDALEMRFHEFTFKRHPECAVCGTHPTITTPQDQNALCDATGIRRLSATELHELLGRSTESNAALLLVDVREPDEFAAGHLAGAINIPVNDLQHRLNEIQGQLTPVFICRSGTRSLAACGMAVRAGITAPAHLEGGLLAWTAAVDPALPVANLS